MELMDCFSHFSPFVMQRADMLRYLTLLLHGGIFSATDTKRIKPISQWENGTSLWQEGRGWLHADEEMARDGAHPRGIELGPPGLVIGIAVDVNEREDWQKVAKQPVCLYLSEARKASLSFTGGIICDSTH